MTGDYVLNQSLPGPFSVIDKHFESIPYICRNSDGGFYAYALSKLMIPKISSFIQNFSLKIESNISKPRFQIISDRYWIWIYKHFIKGLYTCDIKILDQEIYKNLSLI